MATGKKRPFRPFEENQRNRLRHMGSRFEPHGQAIYRMLAERCPSVPLPTPHEQLEWYVASVLKRVDRAIKSLEHVLNSSQEKDARRKRDENLWSLAVIWADPPEGIGPNVILEVFEASNHFEAIREKYIQLQN